MEGYRQYLCLATEFTIQMTYPNRPPGITVLSLFFRSAASWVGEQRRC